MHPLHILLSLVGAVAASPRSPAPKETLQAGEAAAIGPAVIPILQEPWQTRVTRRDIDNFPETTPSTARATRLKGNKEASTSQDSSSSLSSISLFSMSWSSSSLSSEASGAWHPSYAPLSLPSLTSSSRPAGKPSAGAETSPAATTQHDMFKDLTDMLKQAKSTSSSAVTLGYETGSRQGGRLTPIGAASGEHHPLTKRHDETSSSSKPWADELSSGAEWDHSYPPTPGPTDVSSIPSGKPTPSINPSGDHHHVFRKRQKTSSPTVILTPGAEQVSSYPATPLVPISSIPSVKPTRRQDGDVSDFSWASASPIDQLPDLKKGDSPNYSPTGRAPLASAGGFENMPPMPSEYPSGKPVPSGERNPSSWILRPMTTTITRTQPTEGVTTMRKPKHQGRRGLTSPPPEPSTETVTSFLPAASRERERVEDDMSLPSGKPIRSAMRPDNGSSWHWSIKYPDATACPGECRPKTTPAFGDIE